MSSDDLVYLPDDALPDIDELPEDLRVLADIVGVKHAMSAAEAFGGTHINLAGYGRLKKQLRDRSIRKEYDNGLQVVKLARKYRLSIRHIKNIIGTAEPAGKQLRLW